MRAKNTVITFVLLNCFALATVQLVSCESSSDDRSTDEEAASNGDGCKFDDGTHSATVDFHNPDTDYDATYTLDVQVQDCEVTEIDFPKGGWLDDSHISPTELDNDGNASIEDDRGRTWDVHIDD